MRLVGKKKTLPTLHKNLNCAHVQVGKKKTLPTLHKSLNCAHVQYITRASNDKKLKYDGMTM
jgi:hypothetical protein